MPDEPWWQKSLNQADKQTFSIAFANSGWINGCTRKLLTLHSTVCSITAFGAPSWTMLCANRWRVCWIRVMLNGPSVVCPLQEWSDDDEPHPACCASTGVVFPLAVSSTAGRLLSLSCRLTNPLSGPLHAQRHFFARCHTLRAAPA